MEFPDTPISISSETDSGPRTITRNENTIGNDGYSSDDHSAILEVIEDMKLPGSSLDVCPSCFKKFHPDDSIPYKQYHINSHYDN